MSHRRHPSADRLRWAELPPVVTCERSGRWAAAWRSAAAPVDLPERLALVETRSLNECRAQLENCPRAFVLLVADVANIDDWLGFLSWLEQRCPWAVATVAADRFLRPIEPLARELGAVDFVTSPLHLPRLKQLAARHIRRRAQRSASLVDAILAQLPWK